MDRGIENQPALQVTIQEMSSRSGDNHVNQDLGVRKPWSATAFDHNKYSYENNCLPGAHGYVHGRRRGQQVSSRPRYTSPPLGDTEVRGLSLCPLIFPTRKAHPAKSGILPFLTQKTPALIPRNGGSNGWGVLNSKDHRCEAGGKQTPES